MERQSLPRAIKIRRRAEYLTVQRSGRRLHTSRFFLLIATRAPEYAQAPARFGITVSKKVGVAVVRNRLKRLVREVFRRKKSNFPRGTDVVFIAKQNAPGITFAELLEEIEKLCRKQWSQ